MQAATPPFWQIEFEGWNRPTLYISPTTGEMISRRHNLWRIFDFAWMIHIMDYENRTNVNNPLLPVATWSAVFMAISGDRTEERRVGKECGRECRSRGST